MNSFYHKNRHNSAHLTSISNNYFRWLPSGSWNKNHQLFYQEERCKDYSPFLYLPTYPNKKAEKKVEILDRWVLSDMDQNNYLWCECHSMQSHFKLVCIYMSSTNDPPAFLDDAFYLFISSQILSQRADLLQVIPSDQKSFKQLEQSHKGIETKELWTPHPYFLFGVGDKPGIKKRVWKYSPGEWWADPKRKSYQEKLGYIEKRLKRLEKTQPAKARKPKGIAAFLSLINRRKKRPTHER